jgi:hypothetical protein
MLRARPHKARPCTTLPAAGARLMLGAAMPILGSPRYRIPTEPSVVLLAALPLT